MLQLSVRDRKFVLKPQNFNRLDWLYYDARAGNRLLYAVRKMLRGARKKQSSYFPYARYNKLGLFGREHASLQRCIFKFRLSNGRLLKSHLDYLNREGAGLNNEKSIFFNALSDDLERYHVNYYSEERKNQILHNAEFSAEAAARKEQEAVAAGVPRKSDSYYNLFSEASEDESVFRFVLSPEKSSGYSLKNFTKDFMRRLEMELGVPLAWMATEHYDTGKPHTHITLRGRDQFGNKLFLNKELLKHGCRIFSRKILTDYLGERSGIEILDSYKTDIRALNYNKLDFLLANNIDPESGQLSFGRMFVEKKLSNDMISVISQRLTFLEALGFAQKVQVGVWTLDPELHQKMNDVAVKTDINNAIDRMNALFYKNMDVEPMSVEWLEEQGGLFGRIVYREVTGYFDNDVMLYIETDDHKVRGVRLTQQHEVMMPGLKTGNFCSITPRSRYNKIDQAVMAALAQAPVNPETGLRELVLGESFLATYGFKDLLAVKRRLRHFEEFKVCTLTDDGENSVTAVFEATAADQINEIAAKRRSQYNVMPEGSAARDLVSYEEGLGMNFLDRHLMHNCDLATDFYIIQDEDNNYDVMYVPHLSKDESEVTRWGAQLMDSVCRRIEYHMKNNRIFIPNDDEHRLRYGKNFSHRLWAETAEFSRLMSENRTDRMLGNTRNPEGGEEFQGALHVDEALGMVYISEINKEPRTCVVLPLVHNLRKYDGKFIKMKYPELFARNRQARDFYLDIVETDQAGRGACY